MSMNIHIKATRAITADATGEKSEQVSYFECLQTATNDTFEIYGPSERSEEDRIAAYRDWVNRIYPTDYSEYHLEELAEWLDSVKACGYTVKVFWM